MKFENCQFRKLLSNKVYHDQIENLFFLLSHFVFDISELNNQSEIPQ